MLTKIMSRIPQTFVNKTYQKQFGTTSPRYRVVKFQVTKEMIDDYEEKKKAQPPPITDNKQKSNHLLNNSLIMGKVSSDRYRNVIKVAVPKHRFNDYYLMYIRENDDIYAYDELNSKPGDWILLRKVDEPYDIDVEHRVERILYSYGNLIDPLTKKRSFGLYYDEDFEKLEKFKFDS